MNWDHNDSWWLGSILLNAVWFIYAMFQARWTRFQIRNIRYLLFEIEPATQAWMLEKHFRKLRNEEGVMLMKTAQGLLQEKKPRPKKGVTT